MNSKTVMSAFVAMSLIAGQCAFAQGNGNRPDRGGDRDGQRSNERDVRQPQQWRNPGSGHDQERRDHRDERGAGPDHAFYRGEYLPREYRSKQYVVNDWRAHQLYAPPRGYQWVQAGGDYVLVAIATGVILQLLLNQ